MAQAQGIDLTQGGPIQITAQDGIDWRQAEQVVIAKGDAKAVRGNVTVTADRLLARETSDGDRIRMRRRTARYEPCPAMKSSTRRVTARARPALRTASAILRPSPNR